MIITLLELPQIRKLISGILQSGFVNGYEVLVVLRRKPYILHELTKNGGYGLCVLYQHHRFRESPKSWV